MPGTPSSPSDRPLALSSSHSHFQGSTLHLLPSPRHASAFIAAGAPHLSSGQLQVPLLSHGLSQCRPSIHHCRGCSNAFRVATGAPTIFLRALPEGAPVSCRREYSTCQVPPSICKLFWGVPQHPLSLGMFLATLRAATEDTNLPNAPRGTFLCSLLLRKLCLHSG
jgi:hypothetical protein